MDANLFLLFLTGIWIIIAIIQDFKKREVANWLNFSLIIFALAYRLFYSIFSSNYNFLLQGIIGLAIFTALGNLFYYCRLFAGGDAKLLIALGAILPFSLIFKENLILFALFIFALFLFGGIYGFIYSLFILARNTKRFSIEFKGHFAKMKFLIWIFICLSLISLVVIIFFNINILILIPMIILILPILYIYAKSIEECMVINQNVKKLAEGDWLYEKLILGKGKNKKMIKPTWEGLSLKDIKIIQKYKDRIKIKQGIPFTPSFIFAFMFLIYLWYFSFQKILGFFS